MRPLFKLVRTNCLVKRPDRRFVDFYFECVYQFTLNDPAGSGAPVAGIPANISSPSVQSAARIEYDLTFRSSHNPEKIVLLPPFPANDAGAGRNTSLLAHRGTLEPGHPAGIRRKSDPDLDLSTATIPGAATTTATATATGISLSEPGYVFGKPDPTRAIVGCCFFRPCIDLPEFIG